MSFISLRSLATLSCLLLLVFINVSSASGSHIHKRATRTSAPAGCSVVGAGGYESIPDAITALGSSTAAACIFVSKGSYPGGFTINYKGSLTIYGSSSNTGSYSGNEAIITRSIDSTTAGSLDKSSSVNFISPNVKVYNIHFDNSYGKQGTFSQAVAVTANADQLSFYGCSFTSYQDTLYAKAGNQFYKNCYIEGAVDYIFGAASAWFQSCTIASTAAGYITANGRANADSSWYVFDSCTLTGGPAGKVYLGRPWRVLARVQYQFCTMTNAIAAIGWTTMQDGATPTFLEWMNSGPGSDTSARGNGGKDASGAVSKSTIWGNSGSGWVDGSY